VDVTVDYNNSNIEPSLNGIAFLMSSNSKVSPRFPLSIKDSAKALAIFVTLLSDLVCYNSSSNNPVTNF